MQNWIPLFCLLVICFLGFIKLACSKLSSENEKTYGIEFLNKYRDFYNALPSGNFKNDTYQWLILNSAKMQEYMGSYGIVHAYRPAYSNLVYNNYAVIINGISHLRDLYYESSDSFLGGRTLYSQAAAIDDLILTYLGALDCIIDINIKEMKNPLIWLREGFRALVTLPISLIYWSGLMRYSTYNNIANNFFVKLISFAVALVGLISSVVTIVTGYAPFINIIEKII